MKISFLGASETVTGSSYLVETSRAKFLVDCGMFQGVDVVNRNKDDFLYDPASIDFVLLTHAHIDHSGLLPKLYRKGFRGKIFLTPPTRELVELLLLDSAKIQENSRRRYSEASPFENEQWLYDTNDALGTINCLESIELTENKEYMGVQFKFFPVGHILGAASVYIEVDGKNLLFSGDIGRRNQSIIKPFNRNQVIEGINSIDLVVMESLYGATLHPERLNSVANFIDLIRLTLDRYGNVIIPCFAVHRTQEILEILKFAYNYKLIPGNVQTFLDSPLSIEATKIYTKFSRYHNHEAYSLTGKDIRIIDENGHNTEQNSSNNSRFYFDNLKTIKHHKQSLRLAKGDRKIIIAGSGMADGGRILNHLAWGLGEAKNAVLFVGYQAEGTLGFELTSGAKKVLINKRAINVRAEINYIHGFSAHADRDDLMGWVKQYNVNKSTPIYLVHAEPEKSGEFAAYLTENDYTPFIARWKGSIEI